MCIVASCTRVFVALIATEIIKLLVTASFQWLWYPHACVFSIEHIWLKKFFFLVFYYSFLFPFSVFYAVSLLFLLSVCVYEVRRICFVLQQLFFSVSIYLNECFIKFQLSQFAKGMKKEHKMKTKEWNCYAPL